MISKRRPFLVCIVAAAACLSCAGTGKMIGRAGTPGYHLWEYKRGHFNMYSLRDELAIGETVQKQQIEVFTKKKVAVDPHDQAALKARIERVVKRLARVSDLPGLPYEVHLYDKPDVVNAFCMPGGKIGVFTGLFDPKKGLIAANDDDELAAVLGHEIAHATLRHVTRQITALNGLNFLGGVISLGIGRGAGAGWQGAFNQVFAAGAQITLPSYTRRFELEADQVGYYYLVKAGFDPEAAIRVWERVAARAREKGSNDRTHFLSTHPGSADRAVFLRGFSHDVAEVIRREKMIEEGRR